MITTKKIFFIMLLLLVIPLFYCNLAYATLNNVGILDSIQQKYYTSAKSWAGVIQERATWLFLLLATISMVWTFSQLIFHRSSFAELFGEMIRFGMFTGFFLWLLRNGPEMAESIISSLMKIGAQASGQPELLYPSKIVDIGFSVLDKVCANFDPWSPFLTTGSIVLACIILVILALISINMMLQLCAAWVLAYAGIFFLGFGGSRWTSDMALNYFKTVLGLGASLMTMTLLIGVGISILDEYHAKMDPLKLQELAVLLVTSITLLLLVDKLPAMVSGIITGAGIGSMGVGSFGAGAAMGAAMTAGGAAMGMASFAGKTATGVATNVAGAMSAVQAAMNGASGTGGGGSNASGNGAEGSGRSLGDAMGAKPPFAEVAKTLGKGVMNMASNSFQGKASQTMGGKLATTLNSKKSDTDK